MSTLTYLMITVAIVLLWNEVTINTSNGHPLGVDDYYNLIEPKDNVKVWMKPRGKVNMKNLILSIQKIEAKQKQYWMENNHEDVDNVGKTEIDFITIPSEILTTTTTSEPPALRISQQTVAAYEKPVKIANLHEQSETDQKRFFHSALDGWIF